MARYEDVLITADFDHTLTGPDGKIPERNLEAIRYFTENGGAFTVNTGRSGVTARALMQQVPANVPFILMNGSSMVQNGECLELHRIDLEPWGVVNRLVADFPEVEVEVQDNNFHYLLKPTPEKLERYDKLGWTYKIVEPGDDLGPFAKFNVFPKAQMLQEAIANLHVHDDAVALFDKIQAEITELWGDKMVVFRSGSHLLNVHAKGVSKITGARTLQKKLGKKILVCVGDAGNDVPMLDGADYAFCPCDGVVADKYPNLCSSGEGAIADLIYNKIPEIV